MVSSLVERLLVHWYTISKEPNSGVNLIEFLAEKENGAALLLEKVKVAPAGLENNRPEVHDLLEEINVGMADDPWPFFISTLFIGS